MVRVVQDAGRGTLIVPRVDDPPIEFPPGVPVDVPENVAGREPGPWEPYLDDDGAPLLVPADDGRAYRWAEAPLPGVGAHLEVRDLGAGLLAQEDLFRRADTARSRAGHTSVAQPAAVDAAPDDTPKEG